MLAVAKTACNKGAGGDFLRSFFSNARTVHAPLSKLLQLQCRFFIRHCWLTYGFNYGFSHYTTKRAVSSIGSATEFAVT